MTPTSSLVYTRLNDTIQATYEGYENNVLIDSGTLQVYGYMIGTGSYTSISSIRNANPTSNERVPSAFDNTWTGGAVNIPAIHIDEQEGLGVVMAVAPCAFYGINDITSITFETLTGDYVDEWEENGTSYKYITHFSRTIGVTTIGSRAFQTLASPVENTLTSVHLPSTLTYIGMYNFARRIALETINFEDCTSLSFNNSDYYQGTGILLGCTSLTKITIPAQISYLGTQFCAECSGLESIKVLATTPPQLAGTTENTPFYNSTCPIYVPEASVSSYKQDWSIYSSRIQPIFQPYMSVGNTPIDKIDIFSSLGDVGIKVYVGDGDDGILVYSRNKPVPVTSSLVFTYSSTDQCYIVGTDYTSLSSIISDSNASTVGGTSGSGLDNTWTGGDVIIPESYDDGTHGELPVKGIACRAFAGYNDITSVLIPYTMATIGAVAFASFSSTGIDTTMTSFVFEKDSNNQTSIEFIGRNAFQYRTGLSSIEIPNTVTEIGNALFYGCTGLTSLTIPSSVSTIGYIFAYGCTGLTRVNIYSTQTNKRVTTRSSSYCWFWNCSSSCIVHIPSNVSNPQSTYGSYWRYYNNYNQLTYYADL